MNDSIKQVAGAAGVVTTTAGAVVAWLPVVNLVVQILAGIVAIVVGIITANYYHNKNKKL